nr:MFS transporter [Pseudonocardia dioxanivorans]
MVPRSGPAAGPLPAARAPAALYAAGFVTAFGAHAVAATVGSEAGIDAMSLFSLGVVLAVYDGAEVLLKPVFGSLADRWGPRRVLTGGLVAFALVSGGYAVVAATGAVATGPGAVVALMLARLGQGAAASAFSPAAGAMVGRLSPSGKQGRAFGSYGAWKGLGYTGGPLLGGVVVLLGGLSVLFATLGALAALVAVWVLLAVPVLDPLPRRRQTVVDLARRLGSPTFLRPTAALAAGTAALSVGVGFLPVLGAAAGLGPVATGAAVALLALSSTLVQPRAGRAHDRGTLGTRAALLLGFGPMIAGFVVAATVPGLAGLVPAAVAVGFGVGTLTPVAFATIAATSPPERLGQTMGSAELGRELGDAGGPLLVGAVAAGASTGVGLAVLAGVLAVTGAASLVRTGGTAPHGPDAGAD